MIRAHKIRLHPTPEQEVYFRKAAGTARFVYNWALDRWKTVHADHPGTLYGMMAAKKDFNALKATEFPWVYDVAKDVAEGAFTNVGTALKNYFESTSGRRKGEKIGFPRFKSKKRSKQSFRLNNDKFTVQDHQICIPKLGWVNMAETLRFQGKILGAVVSKVADWWFVSIQVHVETPPPVHFAHASVGVDLGVKTLATLSDGTQFENQKLLRRQLSRLRRLSRAVSRRTRGSHRWWKAKRQLARFHYTMANTRTDVAHKMTATIASTYHTIGVEDLHVKGMMRNHRLALSIADTGMSEIVRQLMYKAEQCGGHVIKVGRFFASSKRCSDCGHVHTALTLSDRTWTCAGCGVTHDRDWNASKNIEAEALRLACV